jgi:hypothetical protein
MQSLEGYMKHFNLVFLISVTSAIGLAMMPADFLSADQESPVKELQEVSDSEALDIPLPIMDQPLDGSSVKTFTEGLEKVDREASEKDYRSLMSSLDYLLFYDISAQRKKELLYASLNGKSPNQIKARVASFRAN